MYRVAGASPPPKSGARVGGEQSCAESTFTCGGAITRYSHVLLAASRLQEPFWLLRIFYPVGARNGGRHLKLVLEAWKRVPPSRYRFP